MEICVMAFGHPLWEKTAAFAENCAWKAGPYLAIKMRNREFTGVERVIAAIEDNQPVGYCTFALKDELAEPSGYAPFIGFVFVDGKHRGKRLSEKLIGAAADYAKSIGYERISIVSGEDGLYEKYGFEKISDVETIYGTTEQLFQKRLVKRSGDQESETDPRKV